MRPINKILIIALLILIAGCASITQTSINSNPYKIRKRVNLHKKQDAKRIEKITNCSKVWTFNHLDSIIELEVIQYHSAYRFDLISIPALIIGLSDTDTIRILCYNHFEKLHKNEKIKVYPDSTEDLKNPFSLYLIHRDLPIFLSKIKKEDRYFCDITRTYFGKVKT